METEELEAIEKEVLKATLQYLNQIKTLTNKCGFGDFLFLPSIYEGSSVGVELTHTTLSNERSQSLAGQILDLEERIKAYPS